MMPFKSEKQRRFMYAKHPSIAKRWTAEAKAKPKSRSQSTSTKRKKRSNGR